MATWDKNTISIKLVVRLTGLPDTAAHTVQFQPINQAYPTGAVAGVQCSDDKSVYQPASDLDTDHHYDIYVDGVWVDRKTSKASNPPIGG